MASGKAARQYLADKMPVHAYCLDSCTENEVGYFHEKYKEEIEGGLMMAFDLLSEAGMLEAAEAFLPLNYINTHGIISDARVHTDSVSQ